MAGLLTLIETDDANATTIQVNYLNTVGTPLTTGISILNDGRAVAGVYYLTFTSVTPAASATLTIDTLDANNPYKNQSGVTVVLDDPTGNPGSGSGRVDIIGGIKLYFSDSGSFSSSWAATLVVGGYFDGSNNAQRITAFGILTAGVETTPKKIGVKNVGDQNCENSVLGVYPGIYFKNNTNTPIFKVKVTSKTATAGKYVITMPSASYIAGPPKTMSVYVTQYAYDSATSSYSTLVQALTLKQATAQCDDTTTYNTIISGVQFIFSSSVTASDQIANVYIENASGIYVATDVAGAPGSWTNSSDITLTESGGGTTGRVQANNTAYFWLKISTAADETPGNLRKYTLRPSGVSIGGLAE